MTAVLALTLFHVLVSLVATGAGISLIQGFLSGKLRPRSKQWFFIVIAATLVTSFLFPFNGVTPAIVVGVLCVAVFVPTLFAGYRGGSGTISRIVYVVGSVILVYFNSLVLIVQSFQKIAPLHALAPVGNELPVIICQVLLLILAIAVGGLSVFRRAAARTA